MQHSRTSGRAEGLKEYIGDEAEELDGFGSGRGRGRLGATINNEDLKLGIKDLLLGLTSDNLEIVLSRDDFDIMEWDGTSGNFSIAKNSSYCSLFNKSLANQLFVCTSAVRVWAGLKSIPVKSTNMPSMMYAVTGSHNLTDSALGSGSVMKLASGGLGL